LDYQAHADNFAKRKYLSVLAQMTAGCFNVVKRGFGTLANLLLGDKQFMQFTCILFSSPENMREKTVSNISASSCQEIQIFSTDSLTTLHFINSRHEIFHYIRKFMNNQF
jgi:hypothetical protein